MRIENNCEHRNARITIYNFGEVSYSFLLGIRICTKLLGRYVVWGSGAIISTDHLYNYSI